MKILTFSILTLGWLALGLATIADQLDSTNVNVVPLGILAQDNADDLADTKSCSFCGTDCTGFSVPAFPKSAKILVVEQLLRTFSTPRYQLLSVYRL